MICTDSALFRWILNNDKLYKIFVRLMEIRKLVDIKSRKLVNSYNNPANMILPGLFSSELLDIFRIQPEELTDFTDWGLL